MKTEIVFDKEIDENRLLIFNPETLEYDFLTEDESIAKVQEAMTPEEGKELDIKVEEGDLILSNGTMSLRLKNMGYYMRSAEEQLPTKINRKKSVSGKFKTSLIVMLALINLVLIDRKVITIPPVRKAERAIKSAYTQIVDRFKEEVVVVDDNEYIIQDTDQSEPVFVIDDQPTPTEATTIAIDETEPTEIPDDEIDQPQYHNEYYNVTFEVRPRPSGSMAYREQARQRYGEKIYEAAAIAGIDPELLLDICTAESFGYHSTGRTASGDVGLFQINIDVWLDYELRYFNYVTQRYESIVFTKENIENADMQPLLGALVLRDSINHLGENLFAGILGYNWGWPRILKDQGDLITDKTEFSFKDDYIVSREYPNYLESVLSFHPDGSTIIYYTKPDSEGNFHQISYDLINPLAKDTLFGKVF